MAAALHLALGQRQALAGGDPQHGLDDVDAGHHFGDGVLDLKPRIDLQEIVAVGAEDEFDGADPAIVQPLAEPHRIGDHTVAKRGGKIGGRGFLDQLLVAPLQRTFALEQMDQIAVAVAGDLDFDMPPALDQFFDDQPGIAEGVVRLAHCGFDFAGKTVQPDHGTHALAAASGRGLQHHRKPEIANDAGDVGGVFACRPAAGDGRDVGRLGLALGRRLVADPFQSLGGRPDEDQLGPLDRAREGGILGQKAKAG